MSAPCGECAVEAAKGTDAMFMCPGPGCECSDSGEECCCVGRERDQLETTCVGCGAVMRGACAQCGEFFKPSPSDDELRAELGSPPPMPLWQVALTARGAAKACEAAEPRRSK